MVKYYGRARQRIGSVNTNQLGLKMSGCPSRVGRNPVNARYIKQRVNCMNGTCGPISIHGVPRFGRYIRNKPPYCREKSSTCLAAAGGIGNINTPYYRTPAPGEKGCGCNNGPCDSELYDAKGLFDNRYANLSKDHPMSWGIKEAKNHPNAVAVPRFYYSGNELAPEILSGIPIDMKDLQREFNGTQFQISVYDPGWALQESSFLNTYRKAPTPFLKGVAGLNYKPNQPDLLRSTNPLSGELQTVNVVGQQFDSTYALQPAMKRYSSGSTTDYDPDTGWETSMELHLWGAMPIDIMYALGCWATGPGDPGPAQFPAQGGSAQDNMKLQKFMVPGRKNVNVLQLWTECWLNVLAQIYNLSIVSGQQYKGYWLNAPNNPNIQEFFNDVSKPGQTLITNLGQNPVLGFDVFASNRKNKVHYAPGVTLRAENGGVTRPLANVNDPYSFTETLRACVRSDFHDAMYYYGRPSKLPPGREILKVVPTLAGGVQFLSPKKSGEISAADFRSTRRDAAAGGTGRQYPIPIIGPDAETISPPDPLKFQQIIGPGPELTPDGANDQGEGTITGGGKSNKSPGGDNVPTGALPFQNVIDAVVINDDDAVSYDFFQYRLACVPPDTKLW